MFTFEGSLTIADHANLNPTELSNQILSMLDQTFRVLALGKHVIHHTGRIQWIMSLPRGGIERIYKVALTDRNADAEVARLVRAIHAQAAPNAVIITPGSTPRNIGEILLAHGFSLQDASTWAYGMALNLRKWSPRVASHQPPSIVEVSSRGEFSQWIDIVNRALFERELMRDEDFNCLRKLSRLHLYLASLAGQPAGVCWALYSGGVVDVNYVATLPQFRRRGIATCLINRALRDAQLRAVTLATLSGEASAMPVYEKIGFKKYFPIKVYEFLKP